MSFAFNFTCIVDIYFAGFTVYGNIFWLGADDFFGYYVGCDSCTRTIPDTNLATAEAGDFEGVAVHGGGVALTCALVSETATWRRRATGGFLEFGIAYFVATLLFAHADKCDVVGAPFVVETT